jgi:hypothetical protein
MNSYDEFSPLSSHSVVKKEKRPEKRPANIITPQSASAFDRTNVSDHDATYLIAATAHKYQLSLNS